jgi:hypothetical protein
MWGKELQSNKSEEPRRGCHTPSVVGVLHTNVLHDLAAPFVDMIMEQLDELVKVVWGEDCVDIEKGMPSIKLCETKESAPHVLAPLPLPLPS